MINQKFLIVFLFILIISPNFVKQAYGARLGVDSIILFQNNDKIVVDGFILEEVCDLNDTSCERYIVCNEYCSIGQVGGYESQKPRVFRLHKLKDGISAKQLNFKLDIKNNIVWSKEIVLPKLNLKVYGNKTGKMGGTTKSRTFKYEINTGTLELLEEYLWESKYHF